MNSNYMNAMYIRIIDNVHLGRMKELAAVLYASFSTTFKKDIIIQWEIMWSKGISNRNYVPYKDTNYSSGKDFMFDVVFKITVQKY